MEEKEERTARNERRKGTKSKQGRKLGEWEGKEEEGKGGWEKGRKEGKGKEKNTSRHINIIYESKLNLFLIIVWSIEHNPPVDLCSRHANATSAERRLFRRSGNQTCGSSSPQKNRRVWACKKFEAVNGIQTRGLLHVIVWLANTRAAARHCRRLSNGLFKKKRRDAVPVPSEPICSADWAIESPHARSFSGFSVSWLSKAERVVSNPEKRKCSCAAAPSRCFTQHSALQAFQGSTTPQLWKHICKLGVWKETWTCDLDFSRSDIYFLSSLLEVGT